MLKIVIQTACLLFFCVLNWEIKAQTKEEKKVLGELKKRNKKAPKITPPNGLWLRDNLFIDRTEVAVVHWQEYIHYLQRDSSANFVNTQLPDTTVFNRVCHIAPIDPEDCLSMMYFYSEPVFRFAPIVGVSYEQAQNYCAWRSAAATETYRQKNPNSKVRFLYRLPTEQEWEEAAQLAYKLPDYPYGYKNLYVQPEKIDMKSLKTMYNFLPEEEKAIEEKLLLYQKYGKQLAFNLNDPNYGIPFLPRQALEWIYLRQPVKSDLLPYHMIGNVAEMVAEKYISKGGSWLNSLSEAKIKTRFRYERSESWLGFRCVCEVIVE